MAHITTQTNPCFFLSPVIACYLSRATTCHNELSRFIVSYQTPSSIVMRAIACHQEPTTRYEAPRVILRLRQLPTHPPTVTPTSILPPKSGSSQKYVRRRSRIGGLASQRKHPSTQPPTRPIETRAGGGAAWPINSLDRSAHAIALMLSCPCAFVLTLPRPRADTDGGPRVIATPIAHALISW